MKEPVYLTAQRTLDDHYTLFYFEHGCPPKVIHCTRELLRWMASNPYLLPTKPTDPYYGAGTTYRGVPLEAHSGRNNSVVYSPLP